MISLFYARDEGHGLGYKNTLPWPTNSTDMKWFRAMTIGKTIVMGSATFESLNMKPLSRRKNIVLTSKPEKYSNLGVLAMSINSPTDFASMFSRSEEVFVIGGPSVLCFFKPVATKLYESVISGTYDQDVGLPSNFASHFDHTLFDFEKNDVKFSIRSI